MEKISVIIPCRNEGGTIEKLISQIENQTGIGTIFNYQLIIVDGRSTDRTREIISCRSKLNKHIILIDNRKIITPVARNLGVKKSSGKFICFIDSHAEVSQNYLRQSLKTIKETGVDCVGGPTIAVGQNYFGRAVAGAYQSPFTSGGSISHKKNYRGFSDSVWGGFYRRSVFDRIGYFDQQLVRNQDDDFNFRLRQSGGKIYQTPKIKFKYFTRRNLWQLFKQNYQFGYWRVKVFQKHKKVTSLRYAIPGIFILSLLVFSIMSFFLLVAPKILVGEIFLYLLLILFASVYTLKYCSPKYFPMLPLIFITYHLAYGIGIIFGLIDFWVLRRTSNFNKTLSR